jgi:hypothetical protein
VKVIGITYLDRYLYEPTLINMTNWAGFEFQGTKPCTYTYGAYIHFLSLSRSLKSRGLPSGLEQLFERLVPRVESRGDTD